MIKNKIFLIFYLGSVCIFLSCNNDKQKIEIDEGLINLDIEYAITKKVKNIYLSELTSKIKYIPLETNDSCLLIGVNNVYLTNDNIFISDSRKLLQFNKDGGFIKRIGRTGNGPGEHALRIKFSIDTINSEAYIYSSERMIVYDIVSGNFKRSFEVNLAVSKFDVLKNNTIVYFTTELPNDGPILFTTNEIYFTDDNGNPVDSIINYNRLKIRSNSIGFANFYRINSSIRYMYNFQNTLYTLNQDFKRAPYAAFNFGNNIEREKLMVEPSYNDVQNEGFLWIPKIFENNKFIFITVQNGTNYAERDLSYLLYDINNEEMYLTHNLLNDIDGGIDFWPNFSFDNILIGICQPFQIIEHYNSNYNTKHFSESFIKLVNNLQEKDNPVLVLIEEEILP